MDNIVWTGQAMLERLVGVVINEEGDHGWDGLSAMR
jgi:hypothetical protein